MRCTMLGGLVLVATAQVVLAQKESVEVEVVEMAIRRKPTIKDVKVFQDPGLDLGLAVRAIGKPILAVDPDKSRLIRFVDDAGTDLAKGAPTGFFSWVTLSSAFREEPVETGVLEISTKTVPSKKAKHLELEAVVALKTVSGTQEKSEPLKLKKGVKIKSGPFPLKLGDVRKVDSGGSALSVQFVSDQSMDAIKEIRFTDSSGKDIETKSRGSGSYGSGGKKTYTRTFGFAKELASVTVHIVSYKDVEIVKVPIKLTMGVGL